MVISVAKTKEKCRLDEELSITVNETNQRAAGCVLQEQL